LWYTSDIVKKWQSNVAFHTYYLQLKRAIESSPRITLNTLHRFGPLVNFHVDRHFIYITTYRNERKEELQSYYKLTEEDMEEITKEWPIEFLVLVEDAELSDPDIIRRPLVTRVEHDGKRSAKKKKKKDEFQDIESDEKDNASEETAPDSFAGGRGDEVNEEEEREEYKHDKGEDTSSKDPL
jgi:hypothetical protein